jgi:RimJ/RimL family protein N-acetyltransferase
MLHPTLKTQRLTLRLHKRDDFQSCFDLWNDPGVYKYIGGKPATDNEVWSKFLRCVGHWEIMGYGYWVVVENSSGKYVGEIGYADWHRDIEPSIKGMPEIGWILHSKAHGKGYATEALQEVIAWGDKNLNSEKTVCIINPENIASLRVAEKMGYKETCRTTFADLPTIIFSRLRLV